MWRARRTNHCQIGFTLVEILVALAIFAVASLLAYRGLNSVVATKKGLDEEIRFWRDLGRVFDRMEMDFSQSVTHPLSVTPDVLGAPFYGSSPNNAFVIAVARQDGDRPPVDVRYRCQDGSLTLSMRPISTATVPDSPASLPAEQTTVLWRGVERCEVAFLGGEGSWRSEWPDGRSRSRPHGVRIRLGIDGHGQFERVYYLP